MPLGWALAGRTGVLVGSGDWDTSPRTEGELCGRESRDRGDVSTSQGTPKVAPNHQNLGEKHRADSPSQPSEGANPADTLILCLQPPEL